MKIVYLPIPKYEYCDHAITAQRWHYGEIKNIPDDATLRFKRNGEVRNVPLVHLHLENFAFKDAATNKNPFFTCSTCDEETTTEYFQHPKSAQMMPNYFDGDRYCNTCFDTIKKQGRLIVHPNSLEITK